MGDQYRPVQGSERVTEPLQEPEEYQTDTESRTGYSVHVTYDVMDVSTRDEARARIMDNLPDLEGVKVTQVQVGKYVITSLADKYKGIL